MKKRRAVKLTHKALQLMKRRAKFTKASTSMKLIKGLMQDKDYAADIQCTLTNFMKLCEDTKAIHISLLSFFAC